MSKDYRRTSENKAVENKPVENKASEKRLSQNIASEKRPSGNMTSENRASALRISSTSSEVTMNKTRRITMVSNLSSKRVSRLNSTLSEMLQSQWEHLMRKFSMDTKLGELKCPIKPPEEISYQTRPLKTFTTGSKYEGTWDAFGMCGFGTYTFPNGAVYIGEFENNLFHGDGQLKYEDGTLVRGKWNRGELLESTIVFADGVHYKEQDWTYCNRPDRRFASEYFDGLQPSGRSYMSEPHPPREIPPGFYDTGDGFYDPVTDLVYKYDDLTSVIRSIGISNMKEWVLQNYRVAPDGPVGPAPELYEEWPRPEKEMPVPPKTLVLSEQPSTESFDFFSLEVSLSALNQKKNSEMSSWVKKGGFFHYDPLDSRRKSRSRSHLPTSRLSSRLGLASRSASAGTFGDNF